MLDGSTLLQNLVLPLSLDIDAIAPEVKRRAESLAEDVGLKLERLGVRAGEATLDERLRAQVARALALDPQIVLLEHPSAMLPRDKVDAFAHDIARVFERRGLTALAVTEDAAFAGPFATRWLTVKPATGEVVPARARWKLFG
jgi:ABC-type lipoprotein export system ATPase subunit